MDDDEVLSERVIHQPPSCIAFCPANPSMFVVGTYKLADNETNSANEGTRSQSRSQSRSGRVEVYQLRKKAVSPGFGVSQCIDKYDFHDCAVLDLHFHAQDPTVFAICTSTSQMVFFRLKNVERAPVGVSIEPSLLKVGSLAIGEDRTVLATSFAWMPQPIMRGPSDMSSAVTFSSGEVKLLQLDLNCDQILSQARIEPAHSLEAWTVAFANLSFPLVDGKSLLTGGDDSTLTLHSIKNDDPSGLLQTKQLFQDRKSHTAGVTAILPVFAAGRLGLNTQAFVTGSYDEHVRVFTHEERPPYKRKIVAELSLGGGVWRLRKLSEHVIEDSQRGYVRSVLILASCMHAGVRIIRVIRRQPKQKSEEWCNWEIDVVGQFTKGHESMCYGADSVDVKRLIDRPCYDDGHRRESVVVSTSFYDKKICVWSFHDGSPSVDEVNGGSEGCQIVRDESAQDKTAEQGRESKHESERRGGTGAEPDIGQEHEPDSVKADSDTSSWTLLPLSPGSDDEVDKEQCMSWASE